MVLKHQFKWDIYGSDVFGASDNVVFRIDAYQEFNGLGFYQYPFPKKRSYFALPLERKSSSGDARR